MNDPIPLNRSYRRVGLATLPFFGAMLAASLFAWATDVDERTDRVMGVACAIWLAFIALSAWLIVAVRRTSILLGEEGAKFLGVVSERVVRPGEITRAEWRASPRALKIRLAKGSLTIRFGEFPTGRRRELVRYFRDRVEPGRQSGWDESWERYASPEDEARLLRNHEDDYRRTLRVLWLGPALGLVIGVGLAAFGGLPSAWTGSLPVDWAIRGLLVSLVLAIGIRGIRWIEEPEPSPGSG